MGANAHFIEREDVAATLLFLGSDAARAITGQIVQLS
jgi:enoyl-[acyl-carrier-protein] reductase (NADH)